MNNDSLVVNTYDANPAGSATSFILGPIQIDGFKHFSVTCITSATLAVAYRICLSPFRDEGYATAGANFTATSVPAASGVDAVVSNKFIDNHCSFLKIEASANSNTTYGALRFTIHGRR